jgi:hypothetical protein
VLRNNAGVFLVLKKFVLFFISVLSFNTAISNQITENPCIPIHIPISDADVNTKYSQQSQMIEGKVITTYQCPSCSPEVFCPACVGNYIIISDEELPMEKIPINKQLYIFFNNNVDAMKRFTTGSTFKGMVENMKISPLFKDIDGKRPLQSNYANIQKCPS